MMVLQGWSAPQVTTVAPSSCNLWTPFSPDTTRTTVKESASCSIHQQRQHNAHAYQQAVQREVLAAAALRVSAAADVDAAHWPLGQS